ncbi:MAG: LacI family transcriptional regulator [Betaproteobacteria bacterium]|nr:LacI family transcriptional regulator [Betaproteobacteria bacterium]
MHRFSVLFLIASATASAAAQPENYPSHPIRWIVPVPAGSSGDFVTRIVTQKIGESWGQQIIIDNRAGGSAIIGSDIIAKASPDGYTFGTLLTPHVVNPAVIKNLPYDTQRDFTPITLMVTVPNVMTMYAGVPATTLKDVIALVKANPGKYNYGTPGTLTSGHLTMEMLKLAAGIDIAYVPYKGGAPAITDLIGGQIQFLISGPPGVLPHIKSGRLKAVGTTALQRLPWLPDTPTFAESGLPGFDTYGWYGIFAPAKLPREIVNRLNADIARVLKLPDIREKFATQGAIPVGNTPEEFAAWLKRETDVWGKIAREVGLKAD